MKLPDWQKLTAAEHPAQAWQAAVTEFLRRYDAMDRALAGAGFPATSTLWRAEIERFMRARRRRWVVRAGRRAGKSSTMCRLAAAWALWGAWYVPAGDRGVVSFVSIDRSEASSRIRTISAILETLGVPFEQRAEELELKDRPVVFRVSTCSANSVGYTSIAIFADECARWEARDSAANPAREVIASQMPTLATQPFGFLVAGSSPWSIDDFHAEMYDQGETDFQVVSEGPTWAFNPTLTEADTHALEPDVRVWSREYLAQPSASVAAAFEPDQVLAAFGRAPTGVPRHEGWVALDPSSLRGRDGFGFMVGRTTDRDEVVIDTCGEFTSVISLRIVARRIAMYCESVRTKRVFSDQREEAGLRSELEHHGIELVAIDWSEKSKEESIAIIRRWLHEERVCVGESPGAQRLRSELLGIKARMMPSGRMQYRTGGADVASCLITLAHAVDRGEIVVGSSGNPMWDAIGAMIARGEMDRPMVTPQLRAQGWA